MTLQSTVTARSYLTAGIAVLGVGAIGLAPVQPLPDHAAAVSHRVVSELGSVVLASSIDPITPWVNTITTSITNIGALIGFALDKPFPILQTVIANWGTYLGELVSGNIGLIPGQILGNIQNLFTAPFNPGEVFDFPIGPSGSGNTVPIPAGTYLSDTQPVDGNSPTVLKDSFNTEIATGLFTDDCQDLGQCSYWPTIAQATTLLSSYGSGVILGLLGPVLAPVAALINSVTAIVDFASAGDFIGAINEVINIPANLVNGFLNGALLDLSPLLSAFGPNPPLNGIGFRLGGLIAGPVPVNGSLDNPNNPPTEFSGGTGYDSLYAVKVTGIGTFTFPGFPTGPIGSMIGMGQYLSNALLVTPPQAQTAATVEAPVRASASAEVANAPVTAAEVRTEAAQEAGDAQAGEDNASTPGRGKARAARNAPATVDADAGSGRKSTPRAAAASRN